MFECVCESGLHRSVSQVQDEQGYDNKAQVVGSLQRESRGCHKNLGNQRIHISIEIRFDHWSSWINDQTSLLMNPLHAHQMGREQWWQVNFTQCCSYWSYSMIMGCKWIVRNDVTIGPSQWSHDDKWFAPNGVPYFQRFYDGQWVLESVMSPRSSPVVNHVYEV
jgi:hypothetical protein